MTDFPMPSRYEQPANLEMFRLALPRMAGYQSDLAHDMVRLALPNTKEGDAFLWIVREHGTHLFDAAERDKFDQHIAFFRKHFASPLLACFHIEVVSIPGDRGFPYVRITEVLS